MMIPWKNSWFQLAGFAAVLSGGVLIMDMFGGKVPTPGRNNNGGYSQNSTTPSNSNYVPPPAPGNLAPQDVNAFTNTLGMKFVPAGTSGVLFGIWDTRVEDFQQFVTATGYNAVGGMYELSKDGKWNQYGTSWQNTGLAEQGNNYPVIGISWDDANAFCQWLTAKEQQSGTISSNQAYRLPTDAEWSAAVGSSLYPWNGSYPPPPSAGNYLRKGDGFSDVSEITDSDGHQIVSPVGAYLPNQYGLYDMGGDVQQWVGDWYHASMNSPDVLNSFTDLRDDGGGQAYRVVRGASWYHCQEPSLRSNFHDKYAADSRYETVGFRCVLTKPFPWMTYLAIGVVILLVAGAAWYFMKPKSPDATPAP